MVKFYLLLINKYFYTIKSPFRVIKGEKKIVDLRLLINK